MTSFVDDLKARVAGGKVVVVLGAGVSIGASGGAESASWPGLLRTGVQRCAEICHELPRGWAGRQLAAIESGDVGEMVGVASQITRWLGGRNGGEYARWLADTIGSLPLTHRDVLESLRDLHLPLVTTNYDHLVEQATGLGPISWQDRRQVEQVLHGDGSAVFHLHGHWKDPDSVILGLESYSDILVDPHAQQAIRALLATKTLLYVGVGAGLQDPNLGALLGWAADVYAQSEYRHYRLVPDSDVESRQREHRPEHRVQVVGIGSHADLAGFLRSLASTRREISPPGVYADPPAPPLRQSPRLPARPPCFGREREIDQVVAALCDQDPRPLPILGPAGSGKTTISLVALHAPQVKQRFGNRRFFVRCDGIKSAAALLGDIARSLGIAPGDNVEARALDHLDGAPATLLIDNLETPWDADREGTESLLATLCGISGLALAASLRGEERPFRVAWRDPVRVPMLPPAAAREAFLDVAGDEFKDDPKLDPLLEQVDRLPLAISLLAYAAQGEPDLGQLYERWRRERAEMLRRASTAVDRLSNAALSFELSINSPRMNDGARKLLSVLAVLSDGVRHEDLREVFPPGAGVDASTLRRVGLAYDESKRLRVLAPIRAHVARHHPPEPRNLGRALAFYLMLAATEGNKAGREGGADAILRLSRELGNLHDVFHIAVRFADLLPAVAAAYGLGEFGRFSGYPAAELIEHVCGEAVRRGDAASEAACRIQLADVALSRSDHRTAAAQFEAALHLFTRIADLLGEANCVQRLGDVALEQADFETADTRYHEALHLCHRAGERLGEATCLYSLGNVALEQSDQDAAGARYEQALPLFRQVGAVLGEANCIKSLGDIALHRSEHDAATGRYQEALPLYQRVGGTLGEANCIRSLGDIALARSDPGGARLQYEKALPLYRRVGNTLGEANCLWVLGHLARDSDPAVARHHFEHALKLYDRIGNHESVGHCCHSLMRLAPDEHERSRLRNRAEGAWRMIGREDLVRAHLPAGD